MEEKDEGPPLPPPPCTEDIGDGTTQLEGIICLDMGLLALLDEGGANRKDGARGRQGAAHRVVEDVSLLNRCRHRRRRRRRRRRRLKHSVGRQTLKR